MLVKDLVLATACAGESVLVFLPGMGEITEACAGASGVSGRARGHCLRGLCHEPGNQ